MATVLLLLLVLLLRESAAVLNPDCLHCLKGVVNCTVTASTGELVCRAPECIEPPTERLTSGVPNCGKLGRFCQVDVTDINKISNSRTRVSYRPYIFCRASKQENVSLNRCVLAFNSTSLLLCQCTTDNCNNQIVLTGYATPVPSPTASPTASIMPEWWLYGKPHYFQL